MSVTEHWLAFDDGSDVPVAVIVNDAERWDFSERGFRVEGPYVDAATHQGAVARADTLEAAVRLAVDTFTAEHHDSFNDRCAVEALQAALEGQ
jgi:hypothetical protein